MPPRKGLSIRAIFNINNNNNNNINDKKKKNRQPLVRLRNIQTYRLITFFQPVAVESSSPVNASGRVFLSKLGRKLADQSGDDREINFSFQRLSVPIQRYNAILLHDCFVKEEEE